MEFVIIVHNMEQKRVSIPFNGKVKIDFDSSKRVFFLFLVIFDCPSGLPASINAYVDARQGHSFKPYKTSFKISGSKVELIQEIPFQWGFQPGFRGQIAAFRKLGANCYQTLLEIAVEEKVKLVEDHLFSMLLN